MQVFSFEALFPSQDAGMKAAAEPASLPPPSCPPTHGDTSIIFNFMGYCPLHTVNKSSIMQHLV